MNEAPPQPQAQPTEQREEPPTGEQPQAAVDTELSEAEQAQEQLLRRVPDDPGGLLREKFRRQWLRKQNAPE